MIDQAKLTQSSATFCNRWQGKNISAGLILGSGWSEALKPFKIIDQVSFSEVPALGASGVEGHAGVIHLAEISTGNLVIFQGRRHWYEGVGFTPIAFPIFLLKSLLAKEVFITNAAGGIRDGLRPGDLVVIKDHINFMGSSPLIGKHLDAFGPRFPDMSNIYAPELRAKLRADAERIGLKLTEGVYAATSGPQYETPAEVEMLKRVGADAVGMSTVPEAILAKAAGLKVLGLSCISNLAAGISKDPLSHEEVKENVGAAMVRVQALFGQFFVNSTVSSAR